MLRNIPRTFSLFSLRLTITAVICWSMNMRIVARSAGIGATTTDHTGLWLNGAINHDREGSVGLNSAGTYNIITLK